MASKEDISEELKPHLVEQNCHHLEKIILSINDTMNPFASNNEKEHLFNMGKQHWVKLASSKTAMTIQTFTRTPSSSKRSRILLLKLVEQLSSKSKSLVQYQWPAISLEASCTMLCKPMEQILSYLLTLVVLSMSYVDGTMQKTPKSKLFQELEKRVASNPPSNVDVTIIDGMFFFHLLHQPPFTFAGLADHLLRQVCIRKGTEIHLVFGKIISPCIKDAERHKRSNQWGMAYQITGTEQKRPSNWLQALRGDKIKEALVTFSINYLENNNSTRILGSKKLIVNNGGTCYSFISQEDRMVKSEEFAYYVKHEEADTRIIYHVGQLPSGTNSQYWCGCDCPRMLPSTTR